jgi:Ca-activated chloride channel family protein
VIFGELYMARFVWFFFIAVVFFIWANKKRRAVKTVFAGKQVLPELSRNEVKGRRDLRYLLISMAILLIILSLMRPQWGFTLQEVKKQGLDILIALDTSKSMLAQDVLPNRLDRSKLAIRDMIRKMKGGDRVGLLAFAGTAFLQCPLTSDYNGFLLSLDDISVNTIPVGGTSITNAVYQSLKSYEGGKQKHKILIMITDGEDLEGGLEAAVKTAKSGGVTICTVGIGTPEGELIPVRDEDGKLTFKKDQEGKVVKTKLDEKTLQAMALETGGMYVRATGAEFGLELIYEKKLSGFEKEEMKSRMEKNYTERYHIPLAAALILLFIEPLVGNRRRGIL